MTSLSALELSKRDLGGYGAARAKDVAFDAVYALWRRRKAEGMKQKDLAEKIGRDRGWVSRNLRGPANWTLETVGEFIVGLNGHLELAAMPIEELAVSRNYDAYLDYDYGANPATASPGPSITLRYDA